jgi:hypothetical protein
LPVKTEKDHLLQNKVTFTPLVDKTLDSPYCFA